MSEYGDGELDFLQMMQNQVKEMAEQQQMVANARDVFRVSFDRLLREGTQRELSLMLATMNCIINRGMEGGLAMAGSFSGLVDAALVIRFGTSLGQNPDEYLLTEL